MQEWGTYIVNRSRRYVLQSGEWKTFVHGLVGLSNIWKFLKIFGNYENLKMKTGITIENLIKIFGLKFIDK